MAAAPETERGPDREARLSNRVFPPATPGLASLLGLAVTVVIITALAVAREVLIPITLAVLLSFMLGPVVALLRRLYLPRSAAVLLAAAGALSIVLLLGAVIGTQIAALSADVPRYAQTIEQKVGTVRGFLTAQMSALNNKIGSISDSPAKPPATSAEQREPIPVEVHTPAPGPFELMQNLLVPVLSPIATAAIVFVVAIFILMQREDLRDRTIRLFGSSDLHRTTAALDDAGRRLGRYYLSLLAVNTGFGCVIGVGLYAIGVPSPVLWGILAGLFRFIPYVGSFGGALFPILLAAAVDPGWTMVIETVALFLLVEPALGQLLEPMIYGHSTGLSPVSVVISAIFWGWIWGGIGLLLSMPLTLCLVVLGKHIKRLEFLYVLLGDAPALSPAESLYQRMLVGDADEALEQAEALIKERSLEQYYDEVAIPSLQLAANDSVRGVLTDAQLDGIMESVSGIVADLGEAQAEAPDPAPGAAGTVLCVAGRGRLDEAVCAMLAQSLAARGQRARIATRAEVSRERLASLDLSDVRLVAISHLEGTAALSPLRYLVRRMRPRIGDLPILACLWTLDRSAGDAERIGAAIRADRYATSLGEAVALAFAPQPGPPEAAPGAAPGEPVAVAV